MTFIFSGRILQFVSSEYWYKGDAMVTHKTQAVVLTCIDFRTYDHAERVLEQAIVERFGVESFDIISLAGGARNLLQDKRRDVVLEDLATSVRLHDPDLIILVNHEDCGAYGGSAQFSDADEEEQFHQEQLEQAAAIARQYVPAEKVKTFYLTLSKSLEHQLA